MAAGSEVSDRVGDRASRACRFRFWLRDNQAPSLDSRVLGLTCERVRVSASQPYRAHNCAVTKTNIGESAGEEHMSQLWVQ